MPIAPSDRSSPAYSKKTGDRPEIGFDPRYRHFQFVSEASAVKSVQNIDPLWPLTKDNAAVSDAVGSGDIILIVTCS
jgi:hypothetical protein